MSAPMTPEQRKAVAHQLGDAKPATDGLLGSLAESVANVRNHDHPKWEDLYCMNLSSYMGERMAPVLRRLLNAEARVERSGRARLLAEYETRTVARERDALRARLAELDGLKLGAVDGRVSATCRDPQHPTWLRAAEDTRECPWCRVAELEADLAAKAQDTEAAVAGWGRARARIEELAAQRDDALVELVTGQAPPEALSPWERAVDGLNALVDADVIFHVEPDGHISAPFSDEHIEWDLKAKRWVLTHDDEGGAA